MPDDPLTSRAPAFPAWQFIGGGVENVMNADPVETTRRAAFAPVEPHAVVTGQMPRAAYQYCTLGMKKLAAITIGLLVVVSLIYVVPRLQRARSAHPLDGLFDVKLKCCGGHESFLELVGDDAFDNCPGHRERKKVAKVVRDSDSATVIDPRDGKPWFRIRWDGAKHSLEFLKRPDSQSWFGMIPVRGQIEQVTDPWRLWIPRLLPE